MITLCTAIQKGGVAKTTSCSGLASGLIAHGKRVLLVDLDPQCNLTFAEGISTNDIQSTLYDVFRGEMAITDVIRSLDLLKDIITGGMALIAADMEYRDVPDNYLMLKKELDKISDRYDFCMIDCPATLGILTTMASTASDGVIIPQILDAFSVQGFIQVYEFLENVRKYCRSDVQIAGILLTKYNKDTYITKALEPVLVDNARELGVKVFDTRIRTSQRLQTAQARQVSSVFDGRSEVAKEYRAFTEEILDMYDGGKS